jgi:hypothetical protein
VATFLPTVVSIDVEPDRRPRARADRVPWQGWTRCLDSFGKARARLAAATGAPVHWSWFFRTDPQIEAIWGSGGWPIEAHRDAVEDLVARGDEIGVHCHPFRWDEAVGRWVEDFEDPRWVATCVDASLAAFERAAGRPCRSFRFGARWLDEASVRRVAERGVRHELTLEPGFPPREDMPPAEFRGRFPDYARAPRGLYRPGDDFLAPGVGRGGPWMIPVTTGSPERRWKALRRRAAGLLVPSRRRPGPWAPLGLACSPRRFERVLDRVLASRATRHLQVVVRSDAALDGERARLEENLALLASRAGPRALRFVRPDEAVAALFPTAAERDVRALETSSTP